MCIVSFRLPQQLRGRASCLPCVPGKFGKNGFCHVMSVTPDSTLPMRTTHHVLLVLQVTLRSRLARLPVCLAFQASIKMVTVQQYVNNAKKVNFPVRIMKRIASIVLLVLLRSRKVKLLVFHVFQASLKNTGLSSCDECDPGQYSSDENPHIMCCLSFWLLRSRLARLPVCLAFQASIKMVTVQQHVNNAKKVNFPVRIMKRIASIVLLVLLRSRKVKLLVFHVFQASLAKILAFRHVMSVTLDSTLPMRTTHHVLLVLLVTLRSRLARASCLPCVPVQVSR